MQVLMLMHCRHYTCHVYIDEDIDLEELACYSLELLSMLRPSGASDHLEQSNFRYRIHLNGALFRVSCPQLARHTQNLKSTTCHSHPAEWCSTW